MDIQANEMMLRRNNFVNNYGFKAQETTPPEAPTTTNPTPEEIIEWKKARMKVLSKLNDRELILMGYRPSQRPIMKVASMYGKDEEDWDILKPSFT